MYNTYGDRCQYCKPGYVGDATKGTRLDCVPESSISQNNVPARLPNWQNYRQQNQNSNKPVERIYARKYQPKVAYNYKQDEHNDDNDDNEDDDDYEDEKK